MLPRRKPKSLNAEPPSSGYVPPGELDMQGLGRLLWQKKKTILSITLIAAAAAFVVVNAITPRYRSESRLLLEARENVFLRADADKIIDRTNVDPEAVTSQVQVVLSRDLGREVIHKEKLTDNPEFDGEGGFSPMRSIMAAIGLGRSPSEMTKEERTMEAYYSRLNVTRNRQVARHCHRLLLGQSRRCGPNRQQRGGNVPVDAAVGEARSDARGRHLAGG